MKNRILFLSALFAAVTASAQTPVPPGQPANPATPSSPAQQPAQAPVVDSATLIANSLNAAYVSNPEDLKGLTTETLKPEHSFPVLGTFNASGSSTTSVTISLDETNKGIVWVEGLPQGKFKAFLKKAPATYKIPAQTTESGKAVSEGTLFYNPSSKEVTIVLGRSFNDEDPTASLTIPTKSNSKVTTYTGIKAAALGTVVTPASQQ